MTNTTSTTLVIEFAFDDDMRPPCMKRPTKMELNKSKLNQTWKLAKLGETKKLELKFSQNSGRN
jgi:hypothetical protein